MKLCDSLICRHCELEEETFEHLLVSCRILDHAKFTSQWSRIFPKIELTQETLSEALYHASCRGTIEEYLIDFVQQNKLFKR